MWKMWFERDGRLYSSDRRECRKTLGVRKRKGEKLEQRSKTAGRT